MKNHRSHVSSGEAKNRGWSRPISASFTNSIEGGNADFVSNYVSLTGTTTDSGSITITSPTVTDTYYTWGDTWYDNGTSDIKIPIDPFLNERISNEINKKVVTKQVEQRTLYKVYVVDPRKGGEILLDGKSVIAKDQQQAMLKAGVLDIALKVGLDIEDVDVYVKEVGTFIRPKKSTQRVKVVKEED